MREPEIYKEEGYGFINHLVVWWYFFQKFIKQIFGPFKLY
jgi:hypothetical protein